MFDFDVILKPCLDDIADSYHNPLSEKLAAKDDYVANIVPL